MRSPYVDPEAIRRQADGGGYDRGVAYYRGGAVEKVAWDDETGILSAEVRGSGSRPYRCAVRLAPGQPRPILSARCTCPMQVNCKHTVAALLAANSITEGRPTPAGSAAAPAAGRPSRMPESAGPSWRDVLGGAAPTGDAVALALCVDLRQRGRRQSSAWGPRRVEAATPRSILERPHDVVVGLRPFMRSASTGAWVKGSASWDAVRRPGGPFLAAHARWFAELHSIAREVRSLTTYSDLADWLVLDTIESSLLWHHLAAAPTLGIPFIGTSGRRPVRLAGSAHAAVRIDRAPGGGLLLAPQVRIDDEPVDAASVRAIGATGIYRFAVEGEEVSLVLAPAALDPRTRALLAADGPVPVPAEDTAEFWQEHAPRLARRVPIEPGEGVEMPAPPAPALRLRIAHRPNDHVEIDAAWVYAGLAPMPIGSAGGQAEPDRDPEGEAVVEAAVVGAWQAVLDEPFSAATSLEGVAAAEFSVHVLPAWEALEGVRVEITGTPRRYRELTGSPHISVTTVDSPDPDWFDLGVIVTIDGRRIPFTPLFTALSQRRRKLLLADGGYFSIAHPALDRLRELIDEAKDLVEWEAGPRISRYQLALWSDFEDLADEAEPALAWRAAAAALRDVTRVPAAPPPERLRATLRPYQRAGYDWLAFLWQHRLGGILADDMGLGKTLQVLALIARTRETGETRPFLVVAPTSVLSTWAEEAARFAPHLRVHVAGQTSGRSSVPLREAVPLADVIVTSYTLLRLDEDDYTRVEWAGAVLDEAQFAKNPQTRVHRAAKALRADVRFALTGTPLENSLTELWALLSITSPGLFPSARRFREEYVGPIEKGKVPENQEGGAFRAGRLARLRRRIHPLVLRRTKEVVAADLPPKQEQHLHIELSPAHRAAYDTTLQRERQKVLGLLDDLDRNRFIVFRSLTLLRMLSLSPRLVDPASTVASSKLDALLGHLAEVVAEGHRTLVFSQFTSFLDIVAEGLDAAGIAHTRLDGATRRRGEVVEGFRAGDTPVFLISLKAGGFGLTLTEADYVFLLDPWWNPAAEAQAVDRAHRIGQTRTVMVYRLIAAGTIEEKVMALQERKARLFRAVLDDDDLFSRALDADDIRALLEP
ncbi:DEAD/DEAH box helicase [Microbacterium hominis]|uniref:DEAD/DEAH box helicase n=1 Tax=Microbacterium hominis TaxID=162426 RepID=A0A7D4Q0W4_9MICO|nr:DEAD/DEAH box helicase [Microbacterium hominis]QKJ19492.1 DEAD/DEAH box helicase [Microbacterium hominis]